jgi:hypothetical protein
MTSRPGGSAKCSRMEGPSLVNKGRRRPGDVVRDDAWGGAAPHDMRPRPSRPVR